MHTFGAKVIQNTILSFPNFKVHILHSDPGKDVHFKFVAFQSADITVGSGKGCPFWDFLNSKFRFDSRIRDRTSILSYSCFEVQSWPSDTGRDVHFEFFVFQSADLISGSWKGWHFDFSGFNGQIWQSDQGKDLHFEFFGLQSADLSIGCGNDVRFWVFLISKCRSDYRIRKRISFRVFRVPKLKEIETSKTRHASTQKHTCSKTCGI